MRNYDDIISNGKLQILTQLNKDDIIQIRAYYTDPVTVKRYWCKFTKAYGWEHLAISPQPQRGKVPEWTVMCKVKEIFWDDEECCIEYHPRKSEYINNNETCLHIWKPLEAEIPEPPSILLGFKDMNSTEAEYLIDSTLQSMTKQQQLDLAKAIGIKVNRKIRRGG